jgi:hypothetical protein
MEVQVSGQLLASPLYPRGKSPRHQNVMATVTYWDFPHTKSLKKRKKNN